jgi:hypothetical protein
LAGNPRHFVKDMKYYTRNVVIGKYGIFIAIFARRQPAKLL